MRVVHKLEKQRADHLLLDAGSVRSDLSQTAGPRIGAPGRTAERLSVRLLATHDHHEHAAVLAVHGEIDLGTAPVLREALLPVLEHQTGPVVLDLSEVAFMDSTGVHVLVDTLERLRLEDRALAVACREGGQVHRVLALVGLLDALTVYHPRGSAATGGDDAPRAWRRPAKRHTAKPVTGAETPNFRPDSPKLPQPGSRRAARAERSV